MANIFKILSKSHPVKKKLLISFSKFEESKNSGETQLWRFEMVFEHFITLTDLVDTLSRFARSTTARHSNLASIGDASHRNLGMWLVSSSSVKYRNL